jgi:hypothetical protein
MPSSAGSASARSKTARLASRAASASASAP